MKTFRSPGTPSPSARRARILPIPLAILAVAFVAVATSSQKRPPLPVPPAKQKLISEKSTPPSPSSAKPTTNDAVALPPALPPPEMTQADLTAFFGGLVPLQIERDDIAGAVVAVVRGGKVIFAEGYGYADLKDKKPVSAETTLFRCGSISKLFTWTAVMQLVEQGKINLDADVNQYLDFNIPARFGKPVTMRNLMTHTPGFEEAIKDLIVEDAAHIPSLHDYLASHQPEEIFVPGSVGAYSNYGATLAGYIVQRVSGQNFDDYIDQHIFGPLDMKYATFRQPLPADLKSFMSTGYQLASGDAKKFEIVTAAPAGSVAISAMSITHFMIAHLHDGVYNGARILQPETVKLMHTAQFAPDPRVHAMCLGFYEETRNGHRIIGHGGDTQYFHSDLHLILDADTGLFVSYNSAGRGDVEPRGPLFQKFLDRYFPYSPPDVKPLPTAAADARSVAGLYIPSRRSQTNMFYLASLVGEMTVSVGKDGKIVTPDLLQISGQPREWREVEPQVWQDTSDAQQRLIFDRDSSGRWYIALGYPFVILQQISWYESKILIQVGLVFSFAVFLLTVLLWPVAAMVRRHYGRKLEWSKQERRARRRARAVCILLLFYWSLLVGSLILKGNDLGFLSSRTDWWFRALQILGWLGALGTLIAVWNFFVSWYTLGRWWFAKLHDALILVACLFTVWIVWYAHLLAFSLRY